MAACRAGTFLRGAIDHRPDPFRKFRRTLRAEPLEDGHDPLQQRRVFAHAIQKMTPIKRGSHGVYQIQDVRPVAAVALQDVQFCPQHLFGRHEPDLLSPQLHRRTA